MNIPVDYLIFKIKILKRLVIGTAVIGTSSFFLGYKGFCLGYIVGNLVAGAVFSLLYKYVLLIRDFGSLKRKRFLIIKALTLYFIMAITLFIAIKKGLDVFLGAALGIISLKLIMFLEVMRKEK